jgi:tetratricopeptide (TPR) repeat protein
MSSLIRLLIGLCAVPALMALAGCAAPRMEVQPQALLKDASFKPPAQRIPLAEDIFALSPEMRAFVHDNPDFRLLVRRQGERQALIDALYAKPLLQLDYDSATTRNAAEAFAARSGNCLSLVIMTAALAKELQLPVRFQTIYTEDFWSRSGNLYFVAGHVNLTLGMPLRSATNAFTIVEPDMLMIDFVRPEALRGHRRIEVDESTIIAMYYNNRAAEMLEEGDVDSAYWWARAAVLQQSHFLAGFNTLAVVYRRHGDDPAAEAALREVLRLEPDNIQALSNLVLVMRDLHRNAEADQLQAKVTELQPYPPFKYFDLGVEAMKEGKFAKARDLFKKEVARSAFYHEFHFWLALSDYALGNMREAGDQLALAAENSPTRKTHDLYAAKLAWLEQQNRLRDLPHIDPVMPINLQQPRSY